MELSQGGFVDPDKILKDFNIAKPGMQIADFGCGAGYFSIPLAELVRPGGEVYAIDIRDTILQLVKSRARSEGLFNINYIKGDLEAKNGSGLRDESQDVVVISNTLFQVEDKEAIIEEACRVLKKAGKLVITDWLQDAPIGPPEHSRVEKNEARRLARKRGFAFNEELLVDEFHYGLLFTK